MLRFVSLLNDRAQLMLQFAAAWCVICGALLAADGPEFEELRLGYQGQGKVGKWLPVSALVKGLPSDQSVELQVALPDPRGDVYIETVTAAVVPESGTLKLDGYFRSGRIEGSGVVSIVATESNETLVRVPIAFGEDLVPSDGEQPVQRRLLLRRLDALTVLTVGDVEGIEELLRNAAVYSRDRSILQGVKLATVSDLPDNADGLDSIDVILLTDEFQTTQQQAEAIKRWVREGGRLVVSTGGTVGAFLKSEIGAWIGAHFGITDTPIQMRRFNNLEAFVSGASRIQTNLNRRDSWPVARMSSAQVIPLVDSLDGPVVGSQSVGAGIITVVGVDMNQLPFNRWTSLPQFYEVLIFGEKLSPQAADRRRTSRVSQSGVSDLGTQLLAANDAIPQGGQWSTWAVMAMLVGWLILIGPLDYLLVTRLFKRPHLTWITFPLLIVGGAMLIFAAAGANGSLQLRQLHILDVTSDQNIQHVKARSWMSVSSPDTMRTTVQAQPTVSIPGLELTTSDGADAGTSETSITAGVQLEWSGRPEEVFGAMYRKGGVGLGQQTFQHSRLAAESVTDLPLLTNGSRAFEATWRATGEEPLVTSELSVSGFGLLKGTFRHHLPQPITEWIVVHGNRVYRADSAAGDFDVLKPDVDWNAKAEGIYASDLKAFLIGARVVERGGSQSSNRGATQISTPYDAQSTDAHYILTMLSLYNYAGGAEYAGLSHTQLKRLEVSDTVRLNHAVLIGRIDLPVTSLSVNNTNLEPAESQTLIRLFIPVDKRPAAGQAKLKEDLEKELQGESENQQ